MATVMNSTRNVLREYAKNNGWTLREKRGSSQEDWFERGFERIAVWYNGREALWFATRGDNRIKAEANAPIAKNHASVDERNKGKKDTIIGWFRQENSLAEAPEPEPVEQADSDEPTPAPAERGKKIQEVLRETGLWQTLPEPARPWHDDDTDTIIRALAYLAGQRDRLAEEVRDMTKARDAIRGYLGTI
ncbi:hypothetical protein Mbo2_083 [Rhodococcus phage Mbo2]|uniref:Uncharacterized protein n=1 Tax=Rhodococcus phage Mbo2 TaxID=2936911 RepID=A0A9E7LH84_9CAUD|nr:hypothetical protein Mbo2_083 [Rhodococcus phage Mbo2]